jgi:ureidoglycolate hydrolase
LSAFPGAQTKIAGLSAGKAITVLTSLRNTSQKRFQPFIPKGAQTVTMEKGLRHIHVMTPTDYPILLPFMIKQCSLHYIVPTLAA